MTDMADLAVVEQAAKDLMAEHGLTGWRFDWDNAVRRAGGTHHQTRIITLSRQITAANDEAHALNVILHEIAHALAGPRQGHGPKWREICLRIGGDGKRCYDSDATNTPDLPWNGVCPNGHTAARVHHPRGPRSCKKCSPRYDEAFLFSWTHNGVQVGTLVSPFSPSASPAPAVPPVPVTAYQTATDLPPIPPVGAQVDRPMARVGDAVEFQGKRGRVTAVNLKRYVVLTTDGREFLVPFGIATIIDQDAVPVMAPPIAAFRHGQRVVTHSPGSKYHGLSGTVQKINVRTIKVQLDAGYPLNAPPALLRAA